MKIAVCVKQVPDSETRINLSGPVAELDQSSFTRVLNPYDAYAVEEAVRIKEAREGVEITAITVGPETVKETLKKDCLAVGCDKAVIINDPALAGADNAADRHRADRRPEARAVRPGALRHQGHRRRRRPGGHHGGRAAGHRPTSRPSPSWSWATAA